MIQNLKYELCETLFAYLVKSTQTFLAKNQWENSADNPLIVKIQIM